jgi:hypothetical protein
MHSGHVRPSMDLVFDFHKGRFGVGFAPLFHIAQDLCTRAQPGILVHDLLFPVSFFDGLILPAFLVLGHPHCKKVSHTHGSTDQDQYLPL